MKRLSKEQILMLHSQLIEQTYPTIQAKGTHLGYGLIKNHCMLDGNKRIGIHVMLVFFII